MTLYVVCCLFLLPSWRERDGGQMVKWGWRVHACVCVCVCVCERERERVCERERERESHPQTQMPAHPPRGGNITVNLMNSCYLIPTGTQTLSLFLSLSLSVCLSLSLSLWLVRSFSNRASACYLPYERFSSTQHHADESFIPICTQWLWHSGWGEDLSITVNNWCYPKEHSLQ